MTGQQALAEATARLSAAGVEGAARDARRLLAYAMGCEADHLAAHLQDALTVEASARFTRAIEARETRKPVAQITGVRDFYGRRFRVTADVLDPRPDTETLVETALCVPFRRVLDLGTGSGCILLSLLAERAGTAGVGTDISAAALAVARDNAAILGLAGRVMLTQSDWFAGVDGQFDLIVSNPPYIAADEMPDLAPEVRDHEPHLALTPGSDGLDAYRVIASGAGAHLHPGGALIVEIGATQAADVSRILSQAGFTPQPPIADLDGRDRVILAGHAR